MTEQELIEKQQRCGDQLFAVSRSGKFYRAYGCGAFALARATGYRVIRRPRKCGRFILTAGFPESRLENVLNQIESKGGTIIQRGSDEFFFSGLDGNEDDTLITEQRPNLAPKGMAATKTSGNDRLKESILSFDLSHSTPMDALAFIDKLQRELC